MMSEWKDPYESDSKVYLALLHSSDFILNSIDRLVMLAKDCYRYPFARHLLRYRKFHELPGRYKLAIWYFHPDWPQEWQPEIDDSYLTGKQLEFSAMKKPDALH